MLPSETTPLPLTLDPIILGNHKSSRTGELKRVLRFPLGNTSEGHASGGDRSRSASSSTNEELKHIKESVQDSSKQAGDRVKMFGQNIFKLDKLKENLSSKKRQRSDVASSERSLVNLEKIGNQLHGSTRDSWNQRMEQKPKSAGLVKRSRASVADGQDDSKLPAAPRQLILKEKREDKFPVAKAVPIKMEEKMRRVPAGSDGWEKKIKRKRSVSAVGGRVMNGDVDPKQAMDSKVPADSKLCSSDGPGFRSKSSSGVSGVNKLNRRFESPSPNASTFVRNDQEATSSPKDRTDVLEQRVLLKGNNFNDAEDPDTGDRFFRSNGREGELSSSGPGLLIRGKFSRAPRTSSIMVLDSSTNLESSHGAPQDWEQPPNVNKITAAGDAKEKVHPISSGTSSQPMAKWGGQRPHKKSRLRRANLLSPVTNDSETQNSPQGFGKSELGCRSSEVANNASLHASASNINTLKVRKEFQRVASPAGVSESEESEALENCLKEKAVDGCEVALTTSHYAEGSVLPIKNKMPVCEIGDGVRRQGRSGRGSLMRSVGPPMRNKTDDLMAKPPQSTRPGPERNKSKSGRPAVKKLKDRKGLPRVGSVLVSGSPELMGELDDHETLVAAAKSARNALNQACSSRFWKKMESIFASVSNDDASFLKKQFSLAEERGEDLSLIFGIDYNTSDVLRNKDDADHSDGKQGNNLGQEAVNMGPLCGKFDIGRLCKLPAMFDRVVSALIDDESEEVYQQAEGKNLSPHASDDSHCGSCNQMDIDSKDRDKMESEVESAVEQNQKLCFLDRLSCNKGGASCPFRNSGMSTSGYSNEHSFGDDEYSHLEMGLISEICSSDIGKLQQKELHFSGFPLPDEQYQSMSLNDRVMLELRSIDLCPETLVTRKQKRLRELDKAVISGEDTDRRKVEEIAMNKILEMAYKKRMACRGTNSTKASVRRVPNHVASAFIKRTLARCRKYEETDVSCFREPALQDILFSRPTGKNDGKSLDCVGSGTASNTLNEAFKHQAGAKGSGAISSLPEVFDTRGENTANLSPEQDSEKPGSSKVTSAFDVKSTAVSECQTKTSTRQRLQNSSRSSGFLESPETASLPVTGNPTQPIGVAAATNIPPYVTKEPGGESMDLDKFALDGNHDQDLGSLLNFDVDGLQDCDTAGLEVPPWDDFSSVMIL
ncbi:hypothetical protein CDL15_Pgr025191 [Punica granatum]|uniref:Uncharacterized protein n=1 Tax=Punica granatum TaxID=22663 RepID=A0A218W801_PUNGR|nr:hypothetical protein CDL15_Pgr025191 [Punica granatum]